MPAPDHAAELAHLIDRLGARFGLRRVTRLVPQDTHIPEFAVTAVPAHAPPRNSAIAAASTIEQDTLVPARPIRLFERPEPIEAIAEVPDGPPVQLSLAARAASRSRSAEGPERIAMEWWRDAARPRADARLFPRREPRGRARLALSRGLYGRETEQPRWFLHGVFA